MQAILIEPYKMAKVIDIDPEEEDIIVELGGMVESFKAAIEDQKVRAYCLKSGAADGMAFNCVLNGVRIYGPMLFTGIVRKRQDYSFRGWMAERIMERLNPLCDHKDQSHNNFQI